MGPGTLAGGVLAFAVVSVGGLAVGATLAVAYARIARLAEGDPLVEIALSMVLAYLAFMVADHYLHVSGIMAVVAAGLVAGGLRRRDLAPDARAYLEYYWGYAEFVANSFVFLGLGMGGTAFLGRLADSDVGRRADITYAVLAVVIARLIVVPALVGVSNRLARVEPIGWGDQAVMVWGGGLRGALPLVMALSIPPDFEHRQLILDMTAAVVLFTLLVQGTTVGPLIRACGLQSRGDGGAR
jgi:CPA1 family monovalent cation:H+ antiporter